MDDTRLSLNERARILVVEDDQLLNRVLSQGLENLGYKVVGTAESAESARQLIADTRPDLVITDLSLAGEANGTSLAEEIFDTFGIPSIFLTGHSDRATIERCRIRANFGYLVKPASILQIDATITTALHQSRLERRLNEQATMLSESFEKEHIFRKVMEQAADGTFLCDRHGRIQEWNSTAAAITGLSSSRVLGRYIWQAVYAVTPVQDRSKEAFGQLRWLGKNILQAARAGEFVDHHEFWIQRPDNSRCYIDATLYRIDLESGIMLGCSFRDRTTERNAADGAAVALSFLEIANKAATTDALWRATLEELCVLFARSSSFLRVIGGDGSEILLRTTEDGGTALIDPNQLPGIPCLACLAGDDAHLSLDLPCTEHGTTILTRDAPRLAEASGVCSAAGDILSHAYAWILRIPIKSGESVFGTLLIQGREPRGFDASLIHAVERGLGKVAPAHERMVTQEQLRDRNRELEALRAVSLLINRRVEGKDFTGDVLDSMVTALEYDAALVLGVDAPGADLVVRANCGVEGEAQLSYCSSVSTEFLGLLSGSVGTQVRYMSSGALKAHCSSCPEFYRSALIATVPWSEDGCGVIIVVLSENERPNDPRKLQLLAAVANQLEVGLRNTQLYDELRRLNASLEQLVEERTRRLETVNAFAARCGKTTRVEHLLPGLFESVASELPIAAACCVLVQQGELSVYDWATTPLPEQIQDHLFDAARRELPIVEPLGDDFSRRFIGAVQRNNLVGQAPETIEQVEVLLLEVGEHVFGAVCLGLGAADTLNQDQHRFVETLVGQASESLHRIHRLELQQQYRIEAMLQGLPVGVAFVDENGRIVVGNALAREQIAMLYPEQAPERERRMLPHRVRPSQWSLDAREFATVSPPGRTLEIRSRLIEEDERHGWALVLRDITSEREQLEQTMLQERLASVGQLAAGIAHDFNNILTGIIGYTAYLQMKDAVRDEAKPHLQVIVDQARRAAKLVEQILDFARCPTRDYGSLSIVPLLKEILRFLRRTIPEDIQIELHTELAPEATIYGDPTQIQQVITNLCLNARDAMPHGGELTVRVDTYTHHAGTEQSLPGIGEGEWVRIIVEDNGSGMAPEVRERVLEPFYTTKDPSRGTGLGLSQAYGIVRQHGGLLSIASVVGQGTVVTSYFPSTEQWRRSSAAASTGLPKTFRIGEEPGKYCILIAEDQRPVMEVMRMVLEEQGYTVMTAEDGYTALDMFDLEQDKVSLVIADLVMPRLGGYDLCRALHRRRPHLPVIAVTGFESKALGIEPADLDQFHVVLRKPLDVSLLVREVGAALTRIDGSQGQPQDTHNKGVGT